MGRGRARLRARAGAVVGAVAVAVACVLGVAACGGPARHLEKTRHPENEERVEAAIALAEGIAEGDLAYLAQREEIVRALRALLEDRSALVRQAAIEALATVEGAAATGAIADRLRDRDPWVRRAAAKALGRAGTKEAAEPLAAALRTDESDDVRAAAAEALGKLGAEGALYDLYLGLSDRAPAVRYYSYLALRAITGRDLPPDPRLWREAVPLSPPR